MTAEHTNDPRNVDSADKWPKVGPVMHLTSTLPTDDGSAGAWAGKDQVVPVG